MQSRNTPDYEVSQPSITSMARQYHQVLPAIKYPFYFERFSDVISTTFSITFPSFSTLIKNQESQKFPCNRERTL